MTMPLVAVHISDGVLAWPWLLSAIAIAIVLVALSARRIADHEVPRIGLLTAAFFIASLIHVRLGPSSVHLLLNGLLGLILSSRAALAIAVGLALQALLLGHGGFTTLGINCVVMTIPALLARPIYLRLLRRRHDDLPIARDGALAVAALLHPIIFASLLAILLVGRWLGRRHLLDPHFRAGFAVGFIAVVLTTLLNSATLIVAGEEDWRIIAAAGFVAHLPLAIIEGFITGCATSFLERVKPEMLHTT